MVQSENLLVMKFGGTSVGSVEAIGQIIEITHSVRNDWAKVVIVVSAFSGVTNMLLKSAREAAGGDTATYISAANELRKRHVDVIEAVMDNPARQAQIRQDVLYLLTEFTSLCQAIAVLGEATNRALDAVASIGERMSARIVAGALSNAGLPTQMIEATQLIQADNQYQSAHPNFERSKEKVEKVLAPVLNTGAIPVITGYIAAAEDGSTVTLGRGGSDYSASILAVCLQASELWIWTDVDGVMSADPRLIPDACTIPVVSYKEIGELAYFGAKVLHPRSIRPVIEAGINLRVCNTFNPEHPGTQIILDINHVDNQSIAYDPEGVVKAVTIIKDLSLITVEGRGMLGVPGVAARTFESVASTGTSVPLISQASSEQSICFAVPLKSAGAIVLALEHTFTDEINRRDIDRIWATNEVVILTAVGAGMRHTPGVAGRLFTELGQRKVNVIAIAQGSSEVSISLVVSGEDGIRGLEALHHLVYRCSEKGKRVEANNE